jgi:glycosyltransferase involved in cell wall biosynthesis
MQRLRIDIAVGGRFHADYMAKAFLGAGHEVQLFTSYPKFRFPEIDSSIVYPVLWPEIVYRVSRKIDRERAGERFKRETFGRLISKRRRQSRADLFFCWSSFALESFKTRKQELKILVRDSTHIVHQSDILKEEHAKFGFPYEEDVPLIERELEEYELADRILVLSEFARKTFLDRGVPSSKLHRIRLGVNTTLFNPFNHEAKLPLQVAYFGSLSLRKGIYYLMEATKHFDPSLLKVSLVGPVEKQLLPLLRNYSHAQILGPMPHAELANFARTKDVYVFPSLEDGFPNTLVQAMASGLVPLSTQNCGPAELIRPGVNGEIIEPGSVESIAEKLKAWVQDISLLKLQKEKAFLTAQGLTWNAYGAELNEWVTTLTTRTPKSVPRKKEQSLGLSLSR